MVSSSEEEEISESDRSDPNVEPTATGPGFLVMLTGSKRAPAEEKASEVKDTKRVKPKPGPVISEKKWSVTNDDTKEKLFQRLWSEDDEIVILKGMTDYVVKKKSDPAADLNAFRDFIKKDLNVDVTKVQLQDKIRRLKKKYDKNKSKEKQGKKRTLAKAHEQEVYELSKKIWGKNNGNYSGGEAFENPKGNGSAVRKTLSNRTVKVECGDLKEAKREEIENGDIKMVAVKSENLEGANVGKQGLKSEAELFESDKMVKIARERRKLEMEEAELYVKKLGFMWMQMKEVLDALKLQTPHASDPHS
ncbi:unnamed protein product [Fraxinus pennsylvanica]|uniref:Glabrous enhancer-binding protein-like DBD domain-containing protein n=1 Tax=Fraxinus pennsylvanica TaxID=56036 RepID=A0AAD2EH76_9LAMI|nr:unnamed protein product [Fraxinus pennsylvanica]